MSKNRLVFFFPHDEITALMENDPVFKQYWEELGKLSFAQKYKIGDTFKEVYQLETAPESSRDRHHLVFIRKWMLVPLSLWPVDFAGMGRFLCQEIRAGRSLDTRLERVLGMLQKFPAESVRQIITDHENEVRKGDYGRFINKNAKFEAFERATINNPRRIAQWEQIKTDFKDSGVVKFTPKALIRRTLMLERNFRIPGWEFVTWSDEEKAFQTAIDLYCAEWNLFGMEGDRPLLLKLSVNVTHQSVMIVVPCYWRPDFKRDINWANVAALLEALGAESKGEKAARAEAERLEIAIRTYEAAQEAEKRGLQGEARHKFILKTAGLPPRTDERKVRKLIVLAKKFLAPANH